ncbi:hypothetical protein [Streptomyces sp. NPDC126514]|uniref:hypothetical protein n=1 Tax=Streptomyces sp. NPDC126514 TaxID=3155210 RepID=UPI003316544F
MGKEGLAEQGQHAEQATPQPRPSSPLAAHMTKNQASYEGRRLLLTPHRAKQPATEANKPPDAASWPSWSTAAEAVVSF